MALKPGKPAAETPPADWVPVQAVDDPIINNPYEEPSLHYTYKDGKPSRMQGRRDAMYWYTHKKTGTKQIDLFAEEQRDLLPLVNRLRSDVKRWREAGYRGASSVTKDLLAHWSRNDIARPFFFCQREAAETIIYLLEMAIPGRLAATGFRTFEVDTSNLSLLLKGERPRFDELTDDQDFFPKLIDAAMGEEFPVPLRRIGCKMATGSGKTVVMSMLIAWAFCNRGRNPATTLYPNAVLICAPNLTVKERLQVLKPEDSGNYYDSFQIVPPKYREFMNAGRVLVTNWHVFSEKSEHDEGGTSYKVVNKGEETPEAFTKDRLGDLAARLPILVLNDEGHHCWRPKSGTAIDSAALKELSKEEKESLKEEAEEARLWLEGLDKINNAGILGTGQACISACIDLSATPFYLANSGFGQGTPFPWLVSDFGLVDAIESGIVKIPRLPVKDDKGKSDEDGRPDPKYFRLWHHIGTKLTGSDKIKGRPKPEAVYREAEGALLTLAAQWKKRFDEIKAANPGQVPIPPVMILVCNNTDIADYFFRRISGESKEEILSADGKKTESRTVFGDGIMTELSNAEGVTHTVRFDSAMLAKVEAGKGESKDEATKRLREVINSVGKRGGPGEQLRCVVSVSMLTEGWDATNVTHVLGLRAFDSQLLCEQVVGRGLRRMSYLPDPITKKLAPEYVDVYGIPFSLIPFKGKAKETDDTGPDPVYHHVHAVAEREQFAFRLPNVESYTYDLKGSGITCDIDSLEGFVVKEEPTTVYLAATRGYVEDGKAATNDFIEQTREEYYKQVRLNQIVFKLAHLVMADLIQGGEGKGVERLRNIHLARHVLFPELVHIIQKYIERKVTFAAGVDSREVGLETYANRIRERVRDGIVPVAASTEAPLVPILNSFRPYESTGGVDYHTARPVVPLSKSHLNLAMIRSSWETNAINVLEDTDWVECYLPNDKNIGLIIPYEYNGANCKYEPDFVVRLRGGNQVLVEIKGGGGEVHDENKVTAKNAAAKKWVAAFNNIGSYGKWAFIICRDVKELRSMLQPFAVIETPNNVLPFRLMSPKPEERYKTCVPLTTLRAAAGYWSQEQASLDGMLDWVEEWIAFDSATRFEQGMFVAKVEGTSMEPLIPSGSYCLFRQPRAGSRDGRKLLVWHSGLADAQTGGQFTVKVYSSEKVSDADAEWTHQRIVLKPINPDYQPIVLTPRDENEVRVIGEFVEVVGPAA